MKPSLKHTSDEALMKLISKGNKMAYAEIYQRYAKRILHFLFRMLKNDEAKAQDLLHDIFLKIAKNPEKFKGTGSFKSWIFSVAANHCRNYLSRDPYRKQTTIELEEMTGMEEQVHSFESLEKNTLKRDLSMAIQQLIPEYKSVFILRYQQGFSIEEIASISECPTGTVKSRLFQARKKLAAQLEHYKTVRYEQ